MMGRSVNSLRGATTCRPCNWSRVAAGTADIEPHPRPPRRLGAAFQFSTSPQNFPPPQNANEH